MRERFRDVPDYDDPPAGLDEKAVTWKFQSEGWCAGWDARGNAGTVVVVEGRGWDWIVERHEGREVDGHTYARRVVLGDGTEGRFSEAIAAAEAAFRSHP